MTTDDRRRWTPDEFTTFCVALLGHAYGWQTVIAKRLGVDRRTVRRWAQSGGDGPPPNARAELEEMARITAGARMGFPCRDEWIVGDGPRGAAGARREYVIHTTPPRFIARAVTIEYRGDVDLDGEIMEAWAPRRGESPADVDTGIVYRTAYDCQLCEIEWIDPVPGGPEVMRLMEAAADMLEEAGEA